MAYPPATAPVAPTPAPQAAPPLTMTSAEVKDWWDRVKLARQRRKTESDQWKTFFKNYLPPKANDSNADSINSNIHFRNVHLKIAEMWAQCPDLHLTPLEPLTDLVNPQTHAPIPPDDVVAVKRAILMKELGPDGANVDLTILETLFDIFATSGIGFTKICYEADMQPTPVQVPGPPAQQPGAVLGLNPMPGPMITKVEDIAVHEKWLWYHFSSMKGLIPHDWTSTDYDKAPWLGMEFVEELTEATIKKYRLPADFSGNTTRDDLLLETDGSKQGTGLAKLLKGVEIWLYACHYDPGVAHSQIMYRLVLIEGMDTEKPAIYDRSPYQTLGPDATLTRDSLIGNPIHPITLRVCSDQGWILSDTAFTDPLVKQENTWAAQDIKLRDSNVARFLHSDKITEAVDKLKNIDVGQGVAVPHEDMMLGAEKLIAQIPHLEHAQSDVQGRAHLKQAIDETLGLSANQAGAYNRTVRSATESAIVQQNVSVRLKGERNALMRRFLQGVRKFDALIQRYKDTKGYVEIVGADGARRLQLYDQKLLNGRYAYDYAIDSQLANDPDKRQKNVTDYVNFMAKSPFMDQEGIARLVTAEFGYDPARLVHAPKPPGPPPPNVSFRFGGADLAIPEVRQTLGLTGIQLPPQASPEALAAQAQELAKGQPHGGAAPEVQKLSDHHAQETGVMPGHPPMAPPQPAPPQPGRVQ